MLKGLEFNSKADPAVCFLSGEKEMASAGDHHLFNRPSLMEKAGVDGGTALTVIEKILFFFFIAIGAPKPHAAAASIFVFHKRHHILQGIADKNTDLMRKFAAF